MQSLQARGTAKKQDRGIKQRSYEIEALNIRYYDVFSPRILNIADFHHSAVTRLEMLRKISDL